MRQLLADDCVFHSPVVHTPQRGKDLTAGYLSAAMQVLGNGTFRYVREVVGGWSEWERIRPKPALETSKPKTSRPSDAGPAPRSMRETVIPLRPQSEWRRVTTWYSGWAPGWLKPVCRPITRDHAEMRWPGSASTRGASTSAS